jgi:hypothetical protein
MKRLTLGLFLLLGILPPTYAYENQCTHPRITRSALADLNAPSAALPDISAYMSDISTGAYLEDVLPDASSVLSHFYDPQTGERLNIPGAYGSVLNLIGPTDAITLGDRLWGEAVSDYRTGHRSSAYQELGRSLHLLSQDMAQPGHVQNDPHVPYPGTYSHVLNYIEAHAVALLPGLDGTRASQLEAKAEDECNTGPNGLPFGRNAITALPQIAADVYDANAPLSPRPWGIGLARQTYLDSSFPGDLPTPEIDPQSGMLSATGHVNFPGGGEDKAYFWPLQYDVPQSPGNCGLIVHWYLVDGSNILCYDPSIPYEGSFSNGLGNDWWQIPESTVWNAFNGQRMYYIHSSDDITTGDGTLTDTFIAHEIPNAIDYTAGLLQLFGKTVDEISPMVTQAHHGLSQTSFSSGDTFYDDSVTLTIVDPTSAQYPSPSGIYLVTLKNISRGQTRVTHYEGQANVSIPFVSLETGTYLLEVADGFNNKSQRRLPV